MQGELKRVITISWLLLMVSSVSRGQIDRVGGELRYEQRYQDFLYGENLTKILVRNPVLDLRFNGTLLSPRIVAYSLYTSLDAHFVNTTSPYIDYSSKQYTWNQYNLSLNFLPYSPVKFTAAARENSYNLTTDLGPTNNTTSNRQQEQRFELSAHQVPWLPTLNVSYVRTRSFAELGFPYDVVNQTVSFSATGATDTTGSYGLTGTMVDYRDRISNAYDRFFTLQFSAARQLAERHGLSISTEYEQYSGYSILTGSLVYSGVTPDRIRLSTSVGGNVSQTSSWQSRSVAVSQSGSYGITRNLSGGLGLSAFMGKGQESTYRGSRSDEYRTFGTSGFIQYRGMLERMTLLSALTVGASQQEYFSRYNNFSAAFANSVSRPFGAFVFNGYYNFSYSRVLSAQFYDVVDNTAGAIFGGMLTGAIRSHSDLRYRDTRYPGESAMHRNQQTLFFTQRFNSSFMYIIPFHVSLSGSVNWYLSSIRGQSYAWSVTFASPSFFIRGLTVDYAYSRNFDPYYQREVAEHHGSTSYQWRALVFSARARYATFPVRVREVNFKISRFF